MRQMALIVRLFPLLVAVLAIRSGVAYAQSFDCHKANSSIERAVCEDGSLAALDIELSRNLHDLLGLVSSQRSFILKTERRWIAYRDQLCNSTDTATLESQRACLHVAYEKRIGELQDLIQLSREVMPPDAAKISALLGTWKGDYGSTAVPIQLVVRRDGMDEYDPGHSLHCRGMSYRILGQKDGQYFLAVSAPSQCLLDTNDPPTYFVLKPDANNAGWATFQDCLTLADLLKLVRNDKNVYCSGLRLAR